MFKYVAGLLVVVVAAVAILASLQSDEFKVERSATIKAPPEKIFALIADFKQWSAWSPWDKLDPAMKKVVSGADMGKGASYAWEGNSKAGAGRMEILDAQSPSRIEIQIDFLKPIAGRNHILFTLTPGTDATTVNWSMDGPKPFISKLFSLFMNMDKMIGADFEEGLAKLRSAAEKP